MVLLALVAPVWAVQGVDNEVPDPGDCQNLRVPEGNKIASHRFGVGEQIYRWNGTICIFVSPEAVLVVVMVQQTCKPDDTAIARLLLEYVVSEGHGVIDRVNCLQRVNTVGVKAPTDPVDFPGQVARVPYTADAFFYRGRH